MSKKILLKAQCFWFLLLLSKYSVSQAPLIKQWDYRFGGTKDDNLLSFHRALDGGYLMAGYSYSGLNGDKTQPSWGDADYWMVKTDSIGNKEWDKRFGGSEFDYFSCAEVTADGGYILGGYSGSEVSGNKTEPSWGTPDYWIVKTDSLGNLQWDRRFGGADEDYMYTILQTSDGGYLLGGASNSEISGDKTQPNWDVSGNATDYWIVKIDSIGNKEWDKRYGGSWYDSLVDMLQTSDGGYILAGSSSSQVSGDKTQPCWGFMDYWLVKIDSVGNKEWDKRFGGGNTDELFSIIQSSDGGMVMSGSSMSGDGGDKSEPSWGSFDIWIIKTDSIGNLLWEENYGGTDADLAEHQSIIETWDGGYLISGISWSPISGDKTEANVGEKHGWLIKIDQLGNKLWDKTIFTSGDEDECIAIETFNGCYTIANSTFSDSGFYKSQDKRGGDDYWIIKFCDTTFSPLPNSILSVSDMSICQFNCINFFDLSLGNVTGWQWNFEGGTPPNSSVQNPTNICYEISGSYDVTLITSNAYGKDTISFDDFITVFQEPAAPVVTQSNDTLFCSQATTYQWFLNGNIISGATSQILIIDEPGDYSITITDESGCSASSQFSGVLLLPESSFGTDSTNGCPNACFNFENTSVNASTYEWHFPGGNPDYSNEYSPTNICYSNPGVYDVTLIASSNIASDTLTGLGYIIIYSPLVVSILQDGNLLSCLPVAASYQWSLSGDEIPGATSQTIYINETGLYTVNIVDSNGCFTSSFLDVTSIPSPDFVASQAYLCEKFCIDFTDESTNNPTFWQWIFPGGNPSSSTEQNPTNICYDVPGTYDVTLITTNSNGNDTLTLEDYITVYPTPPFPIITQNGNTLTSSAAVTYQWQLDAVDIPGATNQSYEVLQTGIYTVIVSDENDCVNSATQYVDITSIDELSDANISIYPNPSNGNFVIEYSDEFQDKHVNIELANPIGQRVFSSQMKAVSFAFKTEINLTHLADGIYFITLHSEMHSLTTKILIEH